MRGSFNSYPPSPPLPTKKKKKNLALISVERIYKFLWIPGILK